MEQVFVSADMQRPERTLKQSADAITSFVDGFGVGNREALQVP
jgi:hypothetical protein